MNLETKNEVSAWMRKAQGDYDAAVLLEKAVPPQLDIAIYHCHQSAEKAIKAWLVACELPFPKTHDLERLLELANTHSSTLTNLQEAMRILTPYATEFRYPGDMMAPEDSDVTEAILLAGDVLTSIHRIIQNELSDICEHD